MGRVGSASVCNEPSLPTMLYAPLATNKESVPSPPTMSSLSDDHFVVLEQSDEAAWVDLVSESPAPAKQLFERNGAMADDWVTLGEDEAVEHGATMIANTDKLCEQHTEKRTRIDIYKY